MPKRRARNVSRIGIVTVPPSASALKTRSASSGSSIPSVTENSLHLFNAAGRCAYAIRAAMQEFESHSYERVFTTGGPVVGKGGYINDYQTSASVGADLLKEEGLPAELVQMVPSHVIGRDRTYSSAIALREWFREHNMQVRSLNIVTEGAHARRTRLLFEEALGRDVKVGVIAVPSPDFDARHWWYYSEGLEEIVGEGLGYLYAKFFFYPRESDSAAQTDPVGARHLSPAPAPAN